MWGCRSPEGFLSHLPPHTPIPAPPWQGRSGSDPDTGGSSLPGAWESLGWIRAAAELEGRQEDFRVGGDPGKEGALAPAPRRSLASPVLPQSLT